jgi:hypothetical protein
MLIKIPRGIERRNATPGMDLYDYIIGMYEDYIYLLERKEKTVIKKIISYGEIEMVENFTDLLLGKLTIYTKDKKAEILYSTASEGIITELIKIIINKYAKKSYYEVQNGSYQEQEIEVRYMNLLNSMKLSGDIIDISVVQPSIEVKIIDQSLLIKLLHLIIKKYLLPSLHLSNTKELIIISRGNFFKQGVRNAVYSCAISYIPIEKIKGIELIKDNTYYNLQMLKIKLENYTQMFYLDVNNKAAEEYYMNLQNIL